MKKLRGNVAGCKKKKQNLLKTRRSSSSNRRRRRTRSVTLMVRMEKVIVVIKMTGAGTATKNFDDSFHRGNGADNVMEVEY